MITYEPNITLVHGRHVIYLRCYTSFGSGASSGVLAKVANECIITNASKLPKCPLIIQNYVAILGLHGEYKYFMEYMLGINRYIISYNKNDTHYTPLCYNQ